MVGKFGVIDYPLSLALTFVLIGTILYWHIHSHFKTRRYVEENFTTHILSKWRAYVTFVTSGVVIFWLSDIVVANTLLAVFAILYIVRDSRYTRISPWPVIFAPIVVLVFSWRTELVQVGQSGLSQLFNPIVSAPVAFLAALLAYFGWQEAAINERDSVEEALNNRYKGRSYPDFSGHQIIHQSPKVRIEMIEVWESPATSKKVLKYLPGFQFEGTTNLRIEFLTSDETVTLSDLWRSLDSFQKVLSITQYGENKFSIMVSTTTIRGVDRFIQKELMTSIPGLTDRYITLYNQESGYTSQMVKRGSSGDTALFFDDSDIEIGNRVAGNVEYNPVKRIGYLLLSRSELKEVRRIVQSNNVYTWIYPDHPEINTDPVTLRGRADDKKFPKRYFPKIREQSVPEQFKALQPEARPERFRTSLQGLEMVRRRFVDTKIIQVSTRKYTAGGEYSSLDVSIIPAPGDDLGESLDFNGVCHHIPVENFRPTKYGCDIELPEYEYEKQKSTVEEIFAAELTAEYVFSNQYDIGAIYTYEDVYPIFLWHESGERRLVQIAPDLASALNKSIVWENS